MLNCKNASQLVSQSLDRKLNFKERCGLRFHLFMCGACSRFNKQLLLISQAFKKMRLQTEEDTSIKLSEEAKARIIEKIRH